MSMFPSWPSHMSTWSIQTLLAVSIVTQSTPSTSMEPGPWTRILRRMTLLQFLMSKPPMRVAPGSPKMVLLEETATRVLTSTPMVPCTMMTLEPAEEAWDWRAARLVTVTGAVLPPPVVPPFWVHQPTGLQRSAAAQTELVGEKKNAQIGMSARKKRLWNFRFPVFMVPSVVGPLFKARPYELLIP